MSTPLLKLYKGSYTNEQLLAKCTEGAIVFDNSTHRIYAGTDNNKPVMFGSNIQDADFEDSILKIWKVGDAANNPSIELDFSDIASASGMMAVFQALYEKMGLTGQDHDQIDYSGTNYLSDLGTDGHPAKNLVNADKALDAAIKDVADAIDDLDVTEYAQASVDTTTSQTETTVKIKSIKEVDGKIEAGTSTTDIKLDGTYNESTNKIATQSTVTTAVTKADDSPAVYDVTSGEISQDWIGVVNANGIQEGDSFEDDIDKLDTKIAGLADELIKDEQVTQQAISSIANSVGLENDLTLDLSAATLNIIKDDSSVKEALVDLDAAIGEAGKVDDVRINDTTIVANKIANLAVEGTYNASTNKIATQSTVSDAIEGLDVTGYDQAEIDTTTTGQTTLTIKGIKEEDGKIAADSTNDVDVVIDGTYNESTNKIATQSTVTSAIGALDTQSDVHDVVYTPADASNGAKLTFKGVSETDGVIAQGSGTTELQLAKVATTGAAADVTIADSEGHTEQTTVEGAIDEIYDRIEAMEGSFDVIKSVDAGTTPAGVTWTDTSTEPATTVTGTLVASATTFHKVYLVPNGQSGKNSYAEYVTTRTNTGTEQAPVYVYGWEKLGDIDIDLTGYVKSVTVNGTSHAVDTNSTNVTLGNIINDVTGETAITGGETGLVAVTPTNTTDANGVRTSDLATTVKIEEAADGIVKDGTASYTEGHYVIENGKLVSAVGKSSGDTYTISANDGLVKASDVKAYVDSSISEASFRWSEWS